MTDAFSKDFTILAGGKIASAMMRLSGVFHQEGRLRRELLIDNTLSCMEAAGLTPADLPKIAAVMHKEDPEYRASPWTLATLSTLQFGFASTAMKTAVENLSGKKLEESPEHAEAVYNQLMGIRRLHVTRRELFQP